MHCIFILTELNSASDGVFRELWVTVILLSVVVDLQKIENHVVTFPYWFWFSNNLKNV
jgi:hypothetical protein